MSGPTQKRKTGRPKGSNPKTVTRRALVRAAWLGDPIPEGERPVVSPRVRDYLVELAAMRDEDIARAFDRAIDGALEDLQNGSEYAQAQARRFVLRLTQNITQVAHSRDRIELQAASVAIQGAQAQQQFTLAEIEQSFRRGLERLGHSQTFAAAGTDDEPGEPQPQ